MDGLALNHDRLALQKHIDALQLIIDAGGPRRNDYSDLSLALNSIYKHLYVHENGLAKKRADDNEFGAFVSRNLSIFNNTASMHGFSRLKPNGYAGDFEIIERIYNNNVSFLPEYFNWDSYFFNAPSVKAVRARGNVLSVFMNSIRPESLLSVGAGPGLDVCQALTAAGNLRTVTLLDNDPRAIKRAEYNIEALLRSRPNINVLPTFFVKNALRFRTEQTFDLIWSSGLFDYFNDKIFTFVLSRLRSLLKENGTIVVGNFSESNPDRAYMELIGDWFLVHRTPADLIRLGEAAGFKLDQLSVTSDPTGINLFLVAKAS